MRRRRRRDCRLRSKCRRSRSRCERDGLQSGLKSRNSRLSVELPPGAPLALQGDEPDDFSWFGKPETETAKVIKGDRALADFAALLFPSDFAVAAVYAAPEAAKAAAASCVEIKSSTRLQCERMRPFRRKPFGCASRTRREQSIRPKISRIDVDLTEMESSEVWWGPPKPAVDFHTGA